jgi:hypothetical protein
LMLPRDKLIHRKRLMMNQRSAGCSSGIAATQLFALRTAPAVATLGEYSRRYSRLPRKFEEAWRTHSGSDH